MQSRVSLITTAACLTAAIGLVFAAPARAQAPASSAEPGVVCNVKVVSDKVPDVSSLEAWQKSFISDSMSNQEKAIAIWKSVCLFQYQDSPPAEFLHHEDLVYDPIKMFNVYGYAMCSPHSAHMDALARYVGFKARGWGINHHSVCEFYYDNAWHHLDSSLISYFLKDDGSIASLEDMKIAIQDFYKQHPELNPPDEKERDKALRKFEFADGRTGWKKGPKLIASAPQLNAKGWWPAGTHGWYATMQAFDGSSGPGKKAFLYEYSASMGYQLNLQLRAGEKLIRNWANNGMHINKVGGKGDPGCLEDKSNFLKSQQAFMDKLEPKFPNLTNGRIGNGTLEYNVPLASGAFMSAVLQAENLASKATNPAGPAVHVVDAAKPGVLVVRMPSSYVYLGGLLTTNAVVGNGGSITAEISDNNGLDWREIGKFSSSGEQKIDLTKEIARRYDYRVRFTMNGKGTGLESLVLNNDIQHSQRPMPALDKGPNKISFSAGPQESTITIEANNNLNHKGKQVVYTDFHPTLEGMSDKLGVQAATGTMTVPVAVPGEMTRLRANACYRTWGEKEFWSIEASFDDGKTWKKMGDGPAQQGGANMYCVLSEVPAGTKNALVRYKGNKGAGNILGSFRIDADYKAPAFGFRPIKVTYTWEENGQEKSDVHVATSPQDTYTITCAEKPKMKSITMEVATK